MRKSHENVAFENAAPRFTGPTIEVRMVPRTEKKQIDNTLSPFEELFQGSILTGEKANYK